MAKKADTGKTSLSILERVLILNLLPAEENVITLRIIKNLKSTLSFSEDEIKKYDIRTVADETGKSSLRWKPDAPNKDVEIGPKCTEIIIQALNALNDKKKLTEAHLSIYDKFVGEETETK